MGMKKTDPSIRFWKKVNITQDDGCWEWTAGTFSNGYGQFYDGKNKIGAHRFAYQEKYGVLPKEIKVCHKCDNRICVRQSHMFPGTQLDNLLDMIQKGRKINADSKGELNGRAVATEEIVLKMRILYSEGKTKASIAREFGISETQTTRIINGESWSYLK